MAPSCASRTAAGAPRLASRSADLSALRKMPSTPLATSGVWCRKGRSRLGTDSTHCRTPGSCGSRAPPRTGRPSPWGRPRAPRRGRSPGDAGPPGTGASRWDGGGDRRHQPDGTPVLWWRPTIGGRYGKVLGHGRPCPSPPEIRVLRHGWISHACIPEREMKQKAGCEGPRAPIGLDPLDGESSSHRRWGRSSCRPAR